MQRHVRYEDEKRYEWRRITESTIIRYIHFALWNLPFIYTRYKETQTLLKGVLRIRIIVIVSWDQEL